MAPIFYTTFIFSLIFIITFPVNSIHFKFSRFNPNDINLVYQGSAAPLDRLVNFNINDLYTCQAGRVLYSEKVLIWDSKTGKLTDFTTHYTFIINTQNYTAYGHGLAFFLAPFGFQIPPNSDGGFLGLFNTTTMDSPSNKMVHVEFDSYANGEWGETTEHVGINNNSIISSASITWNASKHSGDPVEVWISYNSTTKNLTVYWKYQATIDPQEKTSLSYRVDLTKVLPEWVTVGFSTATGAIGEINYLLSWEFNSTLEKSGDIVGVVALAAYALVWRKRNRSKKLKEEAMHLTSMNDDLERGAGPRRFTYKELDLATNNFSKDRKLGQGGFGAVFKAMDESLEKDYDEKEVECLMIVGLWCAHPDVNLRPSIRQAIQVLNFEVSLPNLPPNRPVATYHAPTTPTIISSVEASITISLQDGR
ncbi:hypothetical protein P8452_69895 [Trifolium repens]|nr:hypothetical protein P8452_69895 [Trifolium repens]